MARLRPHFVLHGFPLQIHPSWLLTIVLIVAAVLALHPAEGDRGQAILVALAGLLLALLCFGSVLVHELAHAVAARRCDLPVRRIVMHTFGGSAELDADALQPRTEALVALAGPAASIALAAGWGALWWVMRGTGGPALGAGWLALANAGMGALTLLPGYPLDGGRIVRAALWYILDDLVAATRLATFYGQALGWILLIGAGLLLLRDRPLLAAALAVAGWTLGTEARRGLRAVVWHDRSKRTPTIHAAFIHAPQIPAARPLDEAVDDLLEGLGPRGDGGPSLVVNERGAPLGILGLDEVRAVKRAQWPALTAGAAMVPVERVLVVSSDQSLDRTLRTITDGAHRYALVVGDEGWRGRPGATIGIVTPRRIVRYLAQGGRLVPDSGDPVTEVGPGEPPPTRERHRRRP